MDTRSEVDLRSPTRRDQVCAALLLDGFSLSVPMPATCFFRMDMEGGNHSWLNL